MTLRILSFAILIVTISILPSKYVESGQATSQEIEQNVKDALKGRDFRRVTATIISTEATLSGSVPTFWAKDQAIKKVLRVDGIETVASELELPEGESDENIAEDVAKVVQRYAHYTMWDFINGQVNEGKVSLAGLVTPDRNKKDDLFERIAKIKGVTDVENTIITLPPSSSDTRIRNSIANRLATNIHFERIARMPNPPFHIIVHNGIVTLVGFVQTQIEFLELQQLVAQSNDVLRVENLLQTIR